MTTTWPLSVWIDLLVLELHIHELVWLVLLLCLLQLLGAVTLRFVPIGHTDGLLIFMLYGILLHEYCTLSPFHS